MTKKMILATTFKTDQHYRTSDLKNIGIYPSREIALVHLQQLGFDPHAEHHDFSLNEVDMYETTEAFAPDNI